MMEKGEVLTAVSAKIGVNATMQQSGRERNEVDEIILRRGYCTITVLSRLQMDRKLGF